MPYILVDGQLKLISDAEYAALTNPGSGTTAPITGTDLQIQDEQPIVIPDTAGAIPSQTLVEVAEPKASYPLLTDEELLKIYPQTDPKETGAVMGTVIISDSARAAMSDPAAIAEQQALNQFAAENPPIEPTVTVTELSDDEAAKLFAEAEAAAADPSVDNPVDPAIDPEISVYDPDTLDPGEEFVTEADAIDEDPFEAARLEREQDLIDAENNPFTEEDAVDEDPFEASRLEAEQAFNREELAREEAIAEGIDPNADLADWANTPNYEFLSDLEDGEEATINAATQRAQAQAAIEAQLGQAANGDWRVKLRLAGGAFYLYKDPNINQDGILWPLAVTDGVVFPYTPAIDTTYGANYSQYDLTHSNYRGYFYQNSYVDEISIRATFTAQDTSEANYLLAVIHFFRSVTKMFYGQDPNRGSPPPLVFLQGLGEYQFNLHPCVVKSFNYNLPNDVDYIRARVANINGTPMLHRRDRQTVSTNPIASAIDRLRNAGLPKGAEFCRMPPPTLGTNSPTYVPTKIEISLSLLPIQTRDQVSQQFSLREFASGDLLKGGFW